MDVSPENMFSPPPKKDEGRRIHVEGVSGCGKSILFRMLAYKWATEKKFFKTVYPLVLHVDLEFATDDFYDDVYHASFPENFKISKNEFWSFVENNGHEVLFLLDGYNASNVTEPIHEILRGNMLKRCSFLVSSRIYPYKDTCFRPDSTLYVMGFDSSGIARHFRNLISLCDNKDRFDNFKTLVNDNERDWMKYLSLPYYSVMLFAIFDCMPDTDFSSIRTLTNLMDLFIISILSRYCSRQKLEIEGQEFPEDIISTLKQIQALAYESVMNDRCSYSEVELTERTENPTVVELGILERSPEVLTWRFPCNIVRDFLAAQHLADISTEELQNKLDQDDILTHVNFRPVVQFLCGLLKDNPDSLTLEMLFDEIAKCNKRQFRGVTHSTRGVGSPTRTTGSVLDFEIALSSVHECTPGDDVYNRIRESFPRRMLVRRDGLYPSDLIYGLSQLLCESKVYITQVDVLLQPVHLRLQKLLSQLAHSISQSACVKCLKIQWSSLQLLSHFLSQAMNGNKSIQSVSIDDRSDASLTKATSNTWAELQSACQNMMHVTNFTFINCHDEAVVNHVIHHIASTISVLNLSRCHLNLMSASELSNRLEQFSRLKMLDLSNTKQESADFVAITQGLKLNESITELCLVNINVDRSIISALVEFLKLTPSLERLDISGCTLSTEMCKRLASTMQHTRSFRKLILKNAKITMEGKLLFTNGNLGKARVNGLDEEE